MPTPSGLPTKTDFQNATLDVAHLGRVVNSKDASGAPITTSTNRTGGVNKTLDALEAEYTEAIRNAGGQPLGGGTWQAGQTFTAYNQFMVYNGIAYKPLTTTTLPYGPTGATPDLAFVGPFSDVTDEDITIAQGALVGGVVFPSSGDLAVGMTVPIGTTHLRVDGGIYAMSPIATGSVTVVTSTTATIGGVSVTLEGVFSKIDEEISDIQTKVSNLEISDKLEYFNGKHLPVDPTQSLQIGDSLATWVELVWIDGTPYPLSRSVNGEVTAIDTTSPLKTVSTASDTVYLLDIKHWEKNWINVKSYWLTGDESQNAILHLAAVWGDALLLGKNIGFPEGTYNTFEASMPFGRINGLPPTALLDCKNIVIFGFGRNSILKTESTGGADVLQYNGAKNLHTINLQVTADLLGNLGAGSNGISITAAWDNLTFDNIYMNSLPFVDKGSYLDGGKGFTIQSGGNPEPLDRGTIRATNMHAKACAFGYNYDYDYDIHKNKAPSIIIRGVSERCYEGYVAASPFPDGGTPAQGRFSDGADVEITAIGCQKAVSLGRVYGQKIKCHVVQTFSGVPTNPLTGLAWRSGDTECYAFKSAYSYDTDVALTGWMKFGNGVELAPDGTNTPNRNLNIKSSIGIENGFPLAAIPANGLIGSHLDILGATGDKITNVTSPTNYNVFIINSGIVLSGDVATYGGYFVSPSGLGATSAPANAVLTAQGVLVSTTSARKYKTDERPLPYGLAECMAIQPKVYKSKHELDDRNQEFVGVIADDAHVHVPLLTRWRNGEIDGFEYERLAVVLLAGFQEYVTRTNEELHNLRQEIDALKTGGPSGY